jgi:twitching motility two-component system response regulator PilG
MNQPVTQQNGDQIRILIADADPDTRSLYEELLLPEGWGVIDAIDGRDALVKAFAERPALVVTETRLPMLDGYALCEVLRNDADTRGIPILVVTSETRLALLEHARVIGVDAVLNKPVTPEALVDEIRRLLQHGQRSRTSAPSAAPEPQQKRSQAKAHIRMQTTRPPAQPPALVCPTCYRPLMYELSHVGGVSRRHAEQWDRYKCPGACGRFEYRQRTRNLRRIV